MDRRDQWLQRRDFRHRVNVPVGARHFFIASKDVSAQFLARDLAVEVFTGQTTDWVHGEHTSSRVQGEALRRLSQ